MKTLVRIEAIHKEFPGAKALNGVSFEIGEGEILGLVGENGAGKSTLIKTIGGVFQPDGGSLYYNGDKVRFQSPNDALHKGISIVYQELSLCENLSIRENICIRQLKNAENRFDLKFVDRRHQDDTTRALLALFDLEIDPSTKVGDLSLAQREQVEILRAVNYDPRLIILDEPTGPLSWPEIKKLFELLRDLKKKKTSVLYISHEINEVVDLCDRVVVLRDGEFIKSLDKEEMREDRIANLMVGRELGMMFPEKKPNLFDETALAVEGFTHEEHFENISFKLRKGEILGLCGLIGSGRTELALALFGSIPVKAGTLFIEGKETKITGPGKAMAAGLGYLTEDRKKLGLFLNFSIAENMLSIDIDKYSARRIVRPSRLKAHTIDFMNRFGVKASGHTAVVGTLSGGNQQKILLSRVVSREPRILIIDEPTRGIDIGAKRAIHEHIRDLADKGKSIILISSEMNEVLGMSDRIMILDNGKIVDILNNGSEITQELIMNKIVQFKTKEKENERNVD